MDLETIIFVSDLVLESAVGGFAVCTAILLVYEIILAPSIQDMSDCCKDNDDFQGDFAMNFQYYFQDPRIFCNGRHFKIT